MRLGLWSIGSGRELLTHGRPEPFIEPGRGFNLRQFRDVPSGRLLTLPSNMCTELHLSHVLKDAGNLSHGGIG
jgi:hypothetical protein